MVLQVTADICHVRTMPDTGLFSDAALHIIRRKSKNKVQYTA